VLTVHPSDAAAARALAGIAGRAGPLLSVRRAASGVLLEACAPDLSLLVRAPLPRSELRVVACALPAAAVLAAADAARKSKAPAATDAAWAPSWSGVPDLLGDAGGGAELELGAPEVGCLALVVRACGGDGASRGAWAWPGSALALGPGVLGASRTPWSGSFGGDGPGAWLPAALASLARAGDGPRGLVVSAPVSGEGGWARARLPDGSEACWRYPEGACSPPPAGLVAEALSPRGGAEGALEAAVSPAVVTRAARAAVLVGGGLAWVETGPGEPLGARDPGAIPGLRAGAIRAEVPGPLLAEVLRAEPARSATLSPDGSIVVRGERAAFALAPLPPGTPA
jgi:hypothetical protein